MAYERGRCYFKTMRRLFDWARTWRGHRDACIPSKRFLSCSTTLGSGRMSAGFSCIAPWEYRICIDYKAKKGQWTNTTCRLIRNDAWPRALVNFACFSKSSAVAHTYTPGRLLTSSMLFWSFSFYQYLYRMVCIICCKRILWWIKISEISCWRIQEDAYC